MDIEKNKDKSIYKKIYNFLFVDKNASMKNVGTNLLLKKRIKKCN